MKHQAIVRIRIGQHGKISQRKVIENSLRNYTIASCCHYAYSMLKFVAKIKNLCEKCVSCSEII